MEEKQLKCEQCGEQFTKDTHLEGHRTLSHSLPKSNTCSNVSEAEIEIRRNNYQSELLMERLRKNTLDVKPQSK